MAALADLKPLPQLTPTRPKRPSWPLANCASSRRASSTPGPPATSRAEHPRQRRRQEPKAEATGATIEAAVEIKTCKDKEVCQLMK